MNTKFDLAGLLIGFLIALGLVALASFSGCSSTGTGSTLIKSTAGCLAACAAECATKELEQRLKDCSSREVKPMTKREALREAKRRWGKRAFVRKVKCHIRPPSKTGRGGGGCSGDHGLGCPGGRWYFEVGHLYGLPGLGVGHWIKGVGNSWQEAHDKASEI